MAVCVCVCFIFSFFLFLFFIGTSETSVNFVNHSVRELCSSALSCRRGFVRRDQTISSLLFSCRRLPRINLSTSVMTMAVSKTRTHLKSSTNTFRSHASSPLLPSFPLPHPASRQFTKSSAGEMRVCSVSKNTNPKHKTFVVGVVSVGVVDALTTNTYACGSWVQDVRFLSHDRRPK